MGLHIFEQRYQVLFNDLEAMHLDEFGIPFSTIPKFGVWVPNAIGHCAKAPLRRQTGRGRHGHGIIP